MPQENRASLIATFELGIRSLLLPMMIVGVAVAQNPVPLVNQPLVPDTKVPGGAGFTLTVNGMQSCFRVGDGKLDLVTSNLGPIRVQQRPNTP